MRASFKSVVAAGLALSAIGMSASAVEYGNPLGVPTSIATGIHPAVPIATFDYTNNNNGGLVNQNVTNYNSLTSLGSLTLTVSIRDGDSALGNFDFNNLSIGLDGIDTGIKLNGFADGPITVLDVSGAPQNAAAILTALKADGKLNLSVFDSDVDLAGSAPGANAGDVIAFPGDATLQLRQENTFADDPAAHLVQANATQSAQEFDQVAAVTAVPLPLAAYIAPFGAGLAGIYSRRFRRQK
jgi:hypothetical protein